MKTEIDLGKRFRYIRLEIYKENQIDFCKNLNKYIVSKKIPSDKNLKFTQTMLSKFENSSILYSKKFQLLLNFMYETKNINPAWLTLINNNTQPLYLTQIEINKSLSEIVLNINTKYKSISDDLNDLEIIMMNTVF